MDMAEVDNQGTPGLPCKCFSISTGMALRGAHESLVTVALPQAAEGCQAAGPKGSWHCAPQLE